MKTFPVLAHANNSTGVLVTPKVSVSEDGTETTRMSLMVQQRVLSSYGNTIATRLRTAYTSLSEDAYEVLKEFIIDGEEFPIEGKIIIKETHTPYVKKDGSKQECKQYPAGHPKSGQPVLSGGKRVYRNVIFSALINGVYQQGSEDELLPTDNPNSVPNVSPEDAFEATE